MVYKYTDLINKTKEINHRLQEARDLLEEALYICASTNNQEHGIYETNMECLGEADKYLTKAVKPLKEIIEGKTI